MRYPVRATGWVNPWLWPLMLIVTIVWAITHWLTWLIVHVAFVALTTVAVATQPDITPMTVGMFNYLSVLWAIAAGHIALYIWWLARRRRKRRLQAQQRAAWEAHQRQQWQEFRQ